MNSVEAELLYKTKTTKIKENCLSDCPMFANSLLNAQVKVSPFFFFHEAVMELRWENVKE